MRTETLLLFCSIILHLQDKSLPSFEADITCQILFTSVGNVLRVLRVFTERDKRSASTRSSLIKPFSDKHFTCSAPITVCRINTFRPATPPPPTLRLRRVFETRTRRKYLSQVHSQNFMNFSQEGSFEHTILNIKSINIRFYLSKEFRRM